MVHESKCPKLHGLSNLDECPRTGAWRRPRQLKEADGILMLELSQDDGAKVSGQPNQTCLDSAACIHGVILSSSIA